MNAIMSSPETLYAALLSSLDLLPNALLVVDDGGRVLHANHAGTLAVQNGRTVMIRDGAVRMVSAIHADLLREALYGAREPICIRIPHPPGKPCTILMVPLDNGYGAGGPALLVFIGDPEITREPDAALLARLFGFTVAQAKVAALLMQGKTVVEVAAVLSITEHTARNHLKRLFFKTRTKKQVELVHVLMSSPAALLVSFDKYRRRT